MDEDGEDHSAEAETGSWGDIHMEDRDAKKQLRKEKNRASAAASRARREAYTASLEEEVSHLDVPLPTHLKMPANVIMTATSCPG